MKARFVKALLMLTITATMLSMSACGKKSDEVGLSVSVSAEKETVTYNFTSDDVKDYMDDLSEMYTVVGTVPDSFNYEKSVVKSVTWKESPDISQEGDVTATLSIEVDPVALQALMDGKMDLADETTYISSTETYTIDYPVTLHVVNEADTAALYAAGTTIFGYVPPTDDVQGDNPSNNGSNTGTAATDTSAQNNANQASNSTQTSNNTSSSQNGNGAAKNPSSSSSASNGNNSAGSGNANSSGSAAKPAQPSQPAHTHNWVAHTATRTVVDQDAYDEPITKKIYVCTCGAILDSDSAGWEHIETVHANAFEGGLNKYSCVGKETVVGYTHHDAVTHTESYTDYYYCSCGATK